VRQTKKPQSVSASQLDEVKRLIAEGHEPIAVARHFGVPVRAVHRVCEVFDLYGGKDHCAHSHNFRHGMGDSPTYSSWSSMKQRCNNPSAARYRDYGGRGISYCERWELFDNFHADMGLRPWGKSLDRIDVNGNYEPANCRWATQSEQSKNQRRWIFGGAKRLFDPSAAPCASVLYTHGEVTRVDEPAVGSCGTGDNEAVAA
jgi:hypothetical protein